MAVQLLQKGELVAFPTETVYGLGALAFNPLAVAKVFKIKERTLNNPLLVHISNIKQLDIVTSFVPPLAFKLMEKFWPGPISFILPVHHSVPSIVTAGKNNVGVRMPANEVAIQLIEKAGPLAGTSANISAHSSPTFAQHVRQDFNGKIAAIVDAGPTSVGLESTIIDFSKPTPQILRLGGICVEEIETTIKMKLKLAKSAEEIVYENTVEVILSKDIQDFIRVVGELKNKKKKIGIVNNNYFSKQMVKDVYKEYELNINEPRADFFYLLRDAKAASLDVLVFAPFPENLELVNKALLNRIYKITNRKR